MSHLCLFAKVHQDNQALSFLNDTLIKYREKDGLWGHKAISPSTSINGAMKAIVFYRTLDEEIDNAGKILSYSLKYFKMNDEGCHDCDLAIILNACVPYVKNPLLKYRATKLAKKMTESIISRQRHDGGLSYFGQHCQTHFYGQKISDPLEISDIHGTHLYLWALAELSKINPSAPRLNSIQF